MKNLSMLECVAYQLQADHGMKSDDLYRLFCNASKQFHSQNRTDPDWLEATRAGCRGGLVNSLQPERKVASKVLKATARYG